MSQQPSEGLLSREKLLFIVRDLTRRLMALELSVPLETLENVKPEIPKSSLKRKQFFTKEAKEPSHKKFKIEEVTINSATK